MEIDGMHPTKMGHKRLVEHYARAMQQQGPDFSNPLQWARNEQGSYYWIGRGANPNAHYEGEEIQRGPLSPV